MKRPQKGSTVKQFAYAQKLFNGDGRSKKEIARSVGFSPSVSNNVHNKIEKTEGFQNAMIVMATRSNNLVLAAMAEYEARGFTEFSNKDLNGALNAIATAWERINKQRGEGENKDPEKNPLRKVFMQKVENQTINMNPVNTPSAVTVEATEVKEAETVEEMPDLDF